MHIYTRKYSMRTLRLTLWNRLTSRELLQFKITQTNYALVPNLIQEMNNKKKIYICNEVDDDLDKRYGQIDRYLSQPDSFTKRTYFRPQKDEWVKSTPPRRGIEMILHLGPSKRWNCRENGWVKNRCWIWVKYLAKMMFLFGFFDIYPFFGSNHQ